MGSFTVIGLGNFGGTLAIELHSLGHDVTAIEKDPDHAQIFRDSLPHVVVADATDRATLEAIGCGDTEVAVISLGRDLEASVLAALHLVELEVPKTYAKVVSRTQGRILKRVGITRVIFPEREVARRLAHRISSPNLIDFLPITEGYSVEQIPAPPEFVGKTLREIGLPRRYNLQVIALRESRDPDSKLRVPGGDSIVREEDQLVLLGSNESLARFTEAHHE